MSSLPTAKSEPALTITSLQASCQDYKRRKSTLPRPEKYYNPRMVLQLILDQPMSCYMGIGPDLRSLIDSAISDLRTEFSDDTDNINDRFDKELIDEAYKTLEIKEFSDDTDSNFMETSIQNDIIEASIQNFEMILEEKYTMHLIESICHALIGSFLSGYNTSLLNVPSILIQTDCHLNITTFSQLQSFYCIGGLIGALFAGYFADKYGRKITLIFANFMFMASGILSLLYTFNIFGSINIPLLSFKYFLISRIISGIASGVSTAIVPTYLGEISPPIIRGEIGTLNAFINAFGILFAEIVGCEYLLGNTKRWKYIFIINIIPSMIQIIFIGTLCESPQWVLFNNHTDRARIIFQWLRQRKNVEIDMRSIKTKRYYDETTKIISPQSAKKIKSKYNKSFSSNSSKLSNKERSSLLVNVNEMDEYGTIEYIKQNKIETRITICFIFFITICLQILQQFSGINSVWYYSSMMLQNAGLTSSFQLWIGNILIASTNFFGVLIPVKLIEKLGRKYLLILSCLGMIIASCLLSITLWFAKNIGNAAGYLSIIILIIYVISFAMGLGPIVGLLTVELSPSSHRGCIVSVAFFVNYCANLFVAQYANYIVQYTYYIPFAIICLFGIIFTHFFLVETKGKKENDIQMKILEKITKRVY